MNYAHLPKAGRAAEPGRRARVLSDTQGTRGVVGLGQHPLQLRALLGQWPLGLRSQAPGVRPLEVHESQVWNSEQLGSDLMLSQVLRRKSHFHFPAVVGSLRVTPLSRPSQQGFF